jgi:Glycosyl hydrolase family 99
VGPPAARSQSPATTEQAPPAPPPENPNPVRAAFYYPWFPRGWEQGGVSPFTVYHPSAGLYESSDPEVIRRHVQAMQYGNISAGISSWWGRGDVTDTNFGAELRSSAGTGFHWAVYYELESIGNPSVSALRADLSYLESTYASDPGYLRVDGKWVIFVYSSPDDRCEMADRWQAAAPPDAFVVLKAFPHYEDCGAQPNAWHYYNPLVPTAPLGADSFAITPGYSKPGDGQTLARDLGRWRSEVEEMSTSPARFQLVVSFNEWGEGTAVESAEEWKSDSGYGAYLDVLHEIAP